MKSDKYEPRPCEICGKMYKPGRIDQRSCGSKECQKAINRLYKTEWRQRNLNAAREKNKAHMRKKRNWREPKPDTIIGEGYAERQMAKTLAMVGHIKTEL